jgi:hypothetical protein
LLEDEVRAAAPAGVKPLVSLPAGFHFCFSRALNGAEEDPPTAGRRHAQRDREIRRDDLRRPSEQEVPNRHTGPDQGGVGHIHQPSNAEKYTVDEVQTIKSRIRKAAKARKMGLPDPDEFVELTARVRKKKR